MLQLMPPNSGKPGSAAAAGDRGSDSGGPNENGGGCQCTVASKFGDLFFYEGGLGLGLCTVVFS